MPFFQKNKKEAYELNKGNNSNNLSANNTNNANNTSNLPLKDDKKQNDFNN